jgi:tRNA U34 2-thiouridine synthase MnmA/TrmU
MKCVVGLSGGVQSVAAYLLQQLNEVIGLFYEKLA